MTNWLIDESIGVYFGTAVDMLPASVSDQYKSVTGPQLIKEPLFKNFTSSLNPHSLTLLKQVHSADGYSLTQKYDLPPSFTTEGDFLITTIPSYAVGILTADCLPIVAYDRIHKAVGIAHAGWRGSLVQIAPLFLEAFLTATKAKKSDVQIIFGPSAKSCCYQVDAAWITQAYHLVGNSKELLENALRCTPDGSHFFDLPLFNQLLLEKNGIMPTAIDTSFNQCTIHTSTYCSYRRDGKLAGRQLSAVICL